MVGRFAKCTNSYLCKNISKVFVQKTTTTLLGLSLAVAAILAVSVTTQNAYAHASFVLHPNHATQPTAHEVRIVMGHTNEPTFGVYPGIHDGKHGLEIFLSDRDTKLPIGTASMTADMYYFKNWNKFNAATSLSQATEKEMNVPLSGVHGDKGHFIIREVQKPGIYGYTLHGTVTYFDGSVMPIAPGDPPVGEGLTKFCKLSDPAQPTSKFDTPGWNGGFGCTKSIKDIKFPDKMNDNWG
jgi:hypothetical protein